MRRLRVAGEIDDTPMDVVTMAIESVDELRALIGELRPLEARVLIAIHIDCEKARVVMERYRLTIGELRDIEKAAQRNLLGRAKAKGIIPYEVWKGPVNE